MLSKPMSNTRVMVVESRKMLRSGKGMQALYLVSAERMKASLHCSKGSFGAYRHVRSRIFPCRSVPLVVAHNDHDHLHTLPTLSFTMSTTWRGTFTYVSILFGYLIIKLNNFAVSTSTARSLHAPSVNPSRRLSVSPPRNVARRSSGTSSGRMVRVASRFVFIFTLFDYFRHVPPPHRHLFSPSMLLRRSPKTQDHVSYRHVLLRTRVCFRPCRCELWGSFSAFYFHLFTCDPPCAVPSQACLLTIPLLHRST